MLRQASLCFRLLTETPSSLVSNCEISFISVERDDELLLLLRGAAAAVMADARVPIDAAAANDVINQAAVNLDLALGRPPAAAAVADGADDDGEVRYGHGCQVYGSTMID